MQQFDGALYVLDEFVARLPSMSRSCCHEKGGQACHEALRLIACARGGPGYLAPAIRAVRSPGANTASQSLEVADSLAGEDAGPCSDDTRRTEDTPKNVRAHERMLP